jgi:hypothetical protein
MDSVQTNSKHIRGVIFDLRVYQTKLQPDHQKFDMMVTACHLICRLGKVQASQILTD